MKTVIFTLATARSGTLYLRYLFQNNVRNCVCRHEPFFDWGNPTLFGRAIYDAYAGRVERIRRLLAKKRDYIERLPGEVYLESSHAFLKSSYVAALEFFPQLRLVHLIRDPLKVARSAAYREAWRRRVHAPFHFYRGDDGRKHFAWALTGNEAIFQPFAREQLTLFEWYLLEWIEIENRAMRFLAEYRLQERCFTLHSPADLNDPARIQQMFDFFGLPARKPLRLAGRKNRSLGYSASRSAEEETACARVLERLPGGYLEIFSREPYAGRPWSARLQPSSSNSDHAGAEEHLALR
jgi:hypothetical protein